MAIERPEGVLVEQMLEAGLCVVAIHPNQVKAARARYAVRHGKSDCSHGGLSRFQPCGG